MVWPRLEQLLESHAASGGGSPEGGARRAAAPPRRASAPPRRRAALLGHIEWASFQPREGRFCGCCGFSRAHARALQFEPRAHFGSCAAQRPNAAAVEQGVAGPFPFASTPPWGSN